MLLSFTWACSVGPVSQTWKRVSSTAVQWRWWKVVQCLPTSLDKDFLFPQEGSDHGHTETDSHTQPEGRWREENVHVWQERNNNLKRPQVVSEVLRTAPEFMGALTRVILQDLPSIIIMLTKHLVTFSCPRGEEEEVNDRHKANGPRCCCSTLPSFDAWEKEEECYK